MKPKSKKVLGIIFIIWGVLILLKYVLIGSVFLLFRNNPEFMSGFLLAIAVFGKTFWYISAVSYFITGLCILIGGIYLLRSKPAARIWITVFAAGSLVLALSQTIYSVVVFSGVSEISPVNFIKPVIYMIIFAYLIYFFNKKSTVAALKS